MSARPFRKRKYASVRVDEYVSIDITEALEALSVNELLAELAARNVKPQSPDDLVLEAYEELRRGRVADAMTTLERLLFPKWNDVGECQTDFEMARAS